MTSKFTLASTDHDSIFNFCEKIGYSYCKYRERHARYVYHYLLMRRRAIERRKELVEGLRRLYRERKLSYKDVMCMLSTSKSNAYHILTSAPLRTLHGLNFPTFKGWLTKAKEGIEDCDLIWDEIELIEPYGKEEVIDLTTSKHHNFFANGFLVHNCVTENVGIERMIKNILANPNIRFLVLCGVEPRGHYVGQALLCLKEKGVDSERRIIGAKGAMPYLRNLSDEEIKEFRRRIELINLIGCEDVEAIATRVLKLVREAGEIKEVEVKAREPTSVKTIIASHDDLREFVRDPKGWFLIFLDRERSEIVVEHYAGYDKEAKLDLIVRGKNAHEICATLARLNLISRIDHACYLGRELQKAELALKLGLSYEQDKELEELT